MCMVKDEADILEQCFKSAARWCDSIFVYDNGSGDGSWEKTRSLSRRIKAVVPFKSDPRPFCEDLRGEIFDHYRDLCDDGDWWCRLDADEFYIDDPRSFLAGVSARYDVVWGASFQFYFTEHDLVRYRSDPTLFGASVLVEKKCRYFSNNWSEPRFCRYHHRLRWHPRGWPGPLGPSYPRRIRLKHFQYRSPAQIVLRLKSRTNPDSFSHELTPHWRHRAVSVPTNSVSWLGRVAGADRLQFDDGRATYQIDASVFG